MSHLKARSKSLNGLYPPVNGVMYQRRIRGQNALKDNQNLDLDGYKPHIKEFSKFSQNLFAGENIFIRRKKAMEAYKVLKEDQKACRKLSARESPLSLKETMELEARLPPDPRDDIPQDEIEMFQEFGPLGWFYFQDQLFQNNTNLREYITYLSNLGTLRKVIMSSSTKANR